MKKIEISTAENQQFGHEASVGFWDNGRRAELHGKEHALNFYEDKYVFMRRLLEGELKYGACYALQFPQSTKGQLEAIYIGEKGSHWCSWRGHNQSLESFIKQTEKMVESVNQCPN